MFALPVRHSYSYRPGENMTRVLTATNLKDSYSSSKCCRTVT